MGAEGACLVSKDEKYFVSPPPVIKRSTVGAGDSMVAGMAYMLHQKKSLKEVLAFGVACGTAATMNPGTQLFKKEDAIQLFNTLMSA
jgi:6-phosphofructokinase 2